MSRHARVILCGVVLVLCLAALPVVATGQEATTDSEGRSVTTVSPRATTLLSQVEKLGDPIIYSNFGPGLSYLCCAGWTESGPNSTVAPPPFIQAMAFTPPQGTYKLTQLHVALQWVSGTNDLVLELRTDSGGQPGAKITSWELTALPLFGSTSNTVQTINVENGITVQGGIQYWLVPIAAQDEWAAWNRNSTSTVGTGSLSTDQGATWSSGDFDPNGAFDVRGLRAAAAPTLSPVALMLLAGVLGLVGGCLAYRRTCT
jgi:hypothetical protein